MQNNTASAYLSFLEAYYLYGPLVLFVLFFLVAYLKRLFGNPLDHFQLKRLHFLFFIPFVFFSFALNFYCYESSDFLLGSFLTGTFLYFSVFYVYLLGLLELAKRSVSVEILGEVQQLESDERTEQKVLQAFLQKKEFEECRKKLCLNLIIKQGLAKEVNAKYKLTPLGLWVNRLLNRLLGLYNLVRY